MLRTEIEAGKASFAPHPRRAGRTAIIIVGVALVAVLGGVLMAKAPRDFHTGQSASGSIAQNSNDLLVEARGLLASGKPLDAIKLYDQVLTLQPDNPERSRTADELVALVGRGGATPLDLVRKGEQLAASAVAAGAALSPTRICFDGHRAASAGSPTLRAAPPPRADGVSRPRPAR